MLVEPMAGDSLADNLNPVGRVYYACSTHICVPTSMNQEVGTALGAQAGEKRLADVVREGGFAQLPPGGRDAVQHGARSQTLSEHGRSGGTFLRAVPDNHCALMPAAWTALPTRSLRLLSCWP